jgi:hypothetical protein
MHPSASPLVQLPYVTAGTADKLSKKDGVVAPEQYAALSDQEKDSLFPELEGRDDIKRQIQCVSEHWPQLEFVSSEFKGE